MKFFTYILFRLFVIFFYITPFPVLYLISDFFAFLLGKVVKYRYKVIYQNLSNSFPKLNDLEKKKIIKKAYQNITDIMVESIKSFTMTKKQVSKREVVLNPEAFDEYYSQNKNILGVTGHYANWEWAALCSSHYLKHKPVGFYKPLSNKLIDKFMKRNRGKFGMHLTSINITAKSFEEYKDKKAFFVMVGDQSPSRVSQAYWMEFLNQQTACIHGPERYAKKYDLPVFYIDIQRTKRGYYTVEISKITDNPKDLPEGEITKLFMKKLEEKIQKKPEDWLWSHRRWKIKPPN